MRINVNQSTVITGQQLQCYIPRPGIAAMNAESYDTQGTTTAQARQPSATLRESRSSLAHVPY